MALAGCAHVIYSGTVTNERDGWVMQVTELRDGPNMFKNGPAIYFPERGTKLLWAHTEFDPGEEKERYLAFAYPTKYLPTLLGCARNVVKLPMDPRPK